MNSYEFIEFFKSEIQKEGSVRGWGDKNKISTMYIYDVLNGRNAPGKKILNALGFKRNVTYELESQNETA